MLSDDLLSLSSARLRHAYNCLNEALVLTDAEEYKGATNRSYYAAFHALRAVLILDGFDSKKALRNHFKIQRALFKNRAF